VTETVFKIPKDRLLSLELIRRVNSDRIAAVQAEIAEANAEFGRHIGRLFGDCGHSLAEGETLRVDLDAGEFRVIRPDAPKGEKEQAKAAKKAEAPQAEAPKPELKALPPEEPAAEPKPEAEEAPQEEEQPEPEVDPREAENARLREQLAQGKAE